MALNVRRTPAPEISLAFAAGMLMVYAGRRVVTGSIGHASTIAGLMLLLIVLGLRLLRAGRVAPDRRPSERILAALYAAALVAVAINLAEAVVFPWATGRSLERTAPAVSSAFAFLWPALWIAGALPVAFVELALAPLARSPQWDRGRVRAAASAGLGIALAVVFAFSITYAGRASDVRWDVSYFRTTRAGDSTRGLVRTLDRPVEVYAFFPPGNPVGDEVDTYFAALKAESKLLSFRRLDHTLEPTRAAELGASGNGVVVVAQGTRHESLGLALEMERARSALRKLDGDVQRRLVLLTRPVRTVYFTQGHDEARRAPVDDTDRRNVVGTLYQHFEDNGWIVKELGMAQGLANAVPGDASLVLTLGPRRAFGSAEAAALTTWVAKGGRWLLAVDPEAQLDHAELLGPLGLAFTPTTLANDAVFWRHSSHASDRASLITTGFGTHVSVTGLAKLGVRAPVILLGAGPLRQTAAVTIAGAAAGLKSTVQFSLTGDVNTWIDGDADFEAGPDEPRGVFNLAAAVTLRAPNVPDGREGRALVMGDADALSNLALANPGNQLLFTDAARWLSGEEAMAGEVASEEDVPMTHSRKQDAAWFYGTIFVIPAAVILMGFLVTRRRRTGRARPAAAVTPPPPAFDAQPGASHP